jgi:hypothetical protein
MTSIQLRMINVVMNDCTIISMVHGFDDQVTTLHVEGVYANAFDSIDVWKDGHVNFYSDGDDAKYWAVQRSSLARALKSMRTPDNTF